MIRIDFTEHKVEALLTIQAQGADYPTEEEILSEVQSHNICFGLKSALVNEIAKKKEPIRKMVIASGMVPVFGKDAKLDWLILNKMPEEAATGKHRVDITHSHFFEDVKANQKLVHKFFAESGIDGRSVQDEPISSMGRNIDLPVGRNTHISEDGASLIADMDGSAFIENDKVHIDEIFHVMGDVSYATGDVKFDGPVVIEGDVKSGLRIEARDSIYIGGKVEAANIHSYRGDITVPYGIFGKNGAKIVAGGNLKCGFIQDATVGARRNVIVERYISNSNVSAGGIVELSKNEGLIRGGSIEAEKGIIVKEIGSDRNVRTELHIRDLSVNESQNKLWELSRNRYELTVRQSSLKKRKQFLSVLKARLGALSAEKTNKMEFIRTEIDRIESRIEELNVQELELQKKASKVHFTPEIKIRGVIHKNVSIDFSGLVYHCDVLMDEVKFYRFKNEILVESLLDINHAEYDIFIPRPKSG